MSTIRSVCRGGHSGDFDIGLIQHVTGNWEKNKKPKAGSYKKHWIDRTGQPFPELCQMKECPNKAELGAHISLSTDYYEDYYILPCCQKCNQDPELSEGWHMVKEGAVAVYIDEKSVKSRNYFSGLFFVFVGLAARSAQLFVGFTILPSILSLKRTQTR